MRHSDVMTMRRTSTPRGEEACAIVDEALGLFRATIVKFRDGPSPAAGLFPCCRHPAHITVSDPAQRGSVVRHNVRFDVSTAPSPTHRSPARPHPCLPVCASTSKCPKGPQACIPMLFSRGMSMRTACGQGSTAGPLGPRVDREDENSGVPPLGSLLDLGRQW